MIRLTGFPFQTFLSTADKKTVTSTAFADQRDSGFPAEERNTQASHYSEIGLNQGNLGYSRKTNLRLLLCIRGIESPVALDISGMSGRSPRVCKDRTPSRDRTRSAEHGGNCRTIPLDPRIEMTAEGCHDYPFDLFASPLASTNVSTTARPTFISVLWPRFQLC